MLTLLVASVTLNEKFNWSLPRTQSRLTSDGRGGVTIDRGEESDSTEGGDEDEVMMGLHK